jgi:hypothetical protein
MPTILDLRRKSVRIQSKREYKQSSFPPCRGGANVAAFLDTDPPAKTVIENRMEIFDALQSLADRKPSRLRIPSDYPT